MKATEIVEVLNAKILTGELTDEEVNSACGSDMMSDVLAFHKERMVLLTGLTNPHVLRTADMLDLNLIVFVRGKQPSSEIIEMAEEQNVTVLMTQYTLYEACGRLYQCGLPGASRSMD